ncbi:MAG TPA: rhodanese-like domain-containing protein [Bacteroidales bacterium]|nr:rhodanese-like domain-containing protein [Bacteroidales bacterium]HRR92813.1 rhodanese-like domain-containing protein [Bacteroidales bacterium]HRT89931.1 rhodanese-like domain-containing protein [Bacteroidales bacterium]
MNPRVLLALIIIPLGLVIAAVPQNKTVPYKLTAPELLSEVAERTQFVSPEVIADMLIKKDPTLRLIDVRSQQEFEKYSLPGAINIPLTDLLSEEYADILNQDVKMNVFYSNGSLAANEAWMITRQLGYTNNYVLEGGLNYWYETILNPQKPSSVSSDEEFLRYDLRKGAGMALGGDAEVKDTQDQAAGPSLKPAIKPVAKKKKAAGGC